MSIIIKGMNKPKSCNNCPYLECNNLFGSSVYCPITRTTTIFSSSLKEKCLDNCPLIQVPPHGRLIDADKLVNYQMRGAIKYANGVSATGFENLVVLPIPSLSEIPTVLEADQ